MQPSFTRSLKNMLLVYPFILNYRKVSCWCGRLLSAHRRKSAYRTTAPLDFDPPSRSPADPDAGLWVRRAMTRLDEDDREILMLREYDELSYQEIADLRTLPLNTVRSRLFRARMALKAALVPADHSLRMKR